MKRKSEGGGSFFFFTNYADSKAKATSQKGGKKASWAAANDHEINVLLHSRCCKILAHCDRRKWPRRNCRVKSIELLGRNRQHLDASLVRVP